MALIDPKEHLLKVTLTQHGRKKLSQGDLKVSHYSFFDDEIDYEVSSGTITGSSGKFIPAWGGFVNLNNANLYITGSGRLTGSSSSGSWWCGVVMYLTGGEPVTSEYPIEVGSTLTQGFNLRLHPTNPFTIRVVDGTGTGVVNVYGDWDWDVDGSEGWFAVLVGGNIELSRSYIAVNNRLIDAVVVEGYTPPTVDQEFRIGVRNNGANPFNSGFVAAVGGSDNDVFDQDDADAWFIAIKTALQNGRAWATIPTLKVDHAWEAFNLVDQINPNDKLVEVGAPTKTALVKEYFLNTKINW